MGALYSSNPPPPTIQSLPLISEPKGGRAVMIADSHITKVYLGRSRIILTYALRSKFTGKIGLFFIILIDSLYLQEFVVQRKKFEKKIHTPKKFENCKNFLLEILKTPQDFYSPFLDFSHLCKQL